jgi:hypothetical protein
MPERLIRTTTTGDAWRAILTALLVVAGSMLPPIQAQTFSPPQGRIENVEWSREGTTFTVRYDLVSEDPDAVFEVRLRVSMNGAPFMPVAVSGDVGDKVTAGTGKQISWESAKDTDNQDFDNFEFTVAAVSGRAVPVAEGAPPLPPPSATLLGSWRGVYAGDLPTQLTIERHDGSEFAGVIFVVSKPEEPATELSVEGRLSEVGVVEFSEIGIRDTGAVGRWNLGSASGRISSDGQRMGGTGTDGGNEYPWVLERVTGPGLELAGRWEGEYAGSPAQLIVDRVDGSTLAGRVIVTTRRGREATELEVSGTVTDDAIELREVRVVRQGAVSRWYMGTGTGAIGAGGLQFRGAGRDENGRDYKWGFVRVQRPPA